MTKVFILGATGYLGGDALYSISQSDSAKYNITCLVRDEAKASAIQKAFPNVHTVQGDMDDAELIANEARKADIVLSLASTKHAKSSEAIASGLADPGHHGPGYWIQMSGASLFSVPDIKANSYGNSGGKEYDDVADRDEIWSLVQQSPTRVVEQLVLAQNPSKVRTALLVGPCIYGTGRGPVNTRSIQGPEIAKFTLQNGRAFQCGEGKSVWSTIHVQDLGALIAALVEAAVAGTPDVWNEDGVYCPEDGAMSFGDLAASIAKAARDEGFNKEDNVESFSVEQTNKVMGHGAILLGTNAKQKATRARERLGWKPNKESLADFVPEMVRIEAKRLGVAKS